MRNGTVVKTTFSVTLSLVFCATVAAQETDFNGWEARPGLYFHILQSAESWAGGTVSVEYSPVRDRVSGASALRLTFRESQGSPGLVVYRPPGLVARDRRGIVGISFWVKGDGSEGVGVLGIGEGASVDPRAVFLLKSRTWQPVRLTWGNFSAMPKVDVIRSLHFTVTDGTKLPASYIIDRIRLIRSVTPQATDSEVRKEGAKAAAGEPTVAQRAAALTPTQIDDRIADRIAGVQASIHERLAGLHGTVANLAGSVSALAQNQNQKQPPAPPAAGG